jgi:hypothetical protein
LLQGPRVDSRAPLAVSRRELDVMVGESLATTGFENPVVIRVAALINNCVDVIGNVTTVRMDFLVELLNKNRTKRERGQLMVLRNNFKSMASKLTLLQ